MLDRTAKQKNKYKSDLELMRSENVKLKLEIDSLKKRISLSIVTPAISITTAVTESEIPCPSVSVVKTILKKTTPKF